MKRFFLFIISIAILAVLITGCANDTADTGATTPITTASELQKLKDKYDDYEFWESLDQSVEMICNTVDTDNRITISVRLRDSDGTNIILDEISGRSMPPELIAYEIANAEDVIGEHEFGQNLKVTGTIMKWEDQKKSFSVCDLDADASWDFATEGVMFFAENESHRMPGTENEYGAIGVIDINPVDIIHIDDPEANLASMANLALHNG